jgi:hypothetical protein
LISLPKIQRASYSRNPVAFTNGVISYSKVLGTRSARGFDRGIKVSRKIGSVIGDR